MLKAIYKMLKRDHLSRLSQSEFLPARRHKIVFVCVLVCVCGGMCVLMCVCLCAYRYMWECEIQRSMSAVFLNWSPPCFLMAGLLAGPGLLSLVILTGQWTLRIASPCLQPWGNRCAPLCTAFIGAGLQIQVLIPAQWQFEPSLSPALIQNLKLLSHIQTHHLQPAAMAISFPLLFIEVFQRWHFLPSV